MTVGELKTAIAPLDDALPIIVIGRFFDGDALECEEWFQVRGVTLGMDPDTAENYAHFDCSLLDVFQT